MKIPKSVKRHCAKCNKHTVHKVTEAKKKAKDSTRPLGRSAKKRIQLRGFWRGFGSHGKYSKPAISKYKMAGKKNTKKTDFRYTCSECNKTSTQSSGIRAKKIELV